METVEAFCAEHQVPYKTVLYEWPASLFEALYGAYAKRKVADELSQRRSLEMAALWGNSNYDSEKDPDLRAKFMESVDERYSDALQRLYSADPFASQHDDEDDPDYDDPFWQAMKRGIEKRKLPNPKANVDG